MNVGRLAYHAIQRLLTPYHMATAAEHPRPAGHGRKSVDADEMAVSRQLTEDISASRISVEASVLHTTPEREEDDKRAGSSSDCGEAVGSHSQHQQHQEGGGGSSAESSPVGVQEAQLLSHSVEERLRSFVYAWGKKLVELQPKVHMSEHLCESGLFLFKCLRQLQLNACCEGGLALPELSNETLLVHDLIACFWIAMKHCSIRTQVPNRTLVSKATGAQPELLGQRELSALVLLAWDVNTLLRYGGFVA